MHLMTDILNLLAEFSLGEIDLILKELGELRQRITEQGGYRRRSFWLVLISF